MVIALYRQAFGSADPILPIGDLSALRALMPLYADM
jgi:hypothetical protein